MTITYGDILDADADVIVIPCNSEGVHGAGLAKQFADRFPKQAALYRQDCANPSSSLNLHGYSIHRLDETRYVLFFVTKKTWREDSSKRQLKAVFQALNYFEHNFFAGVLVATPPLGAGLGRLKKQEVVPYIKRSFITLGSYVDVYDLPSNKPKG